MTSNKIKSRTSTTQNLPWGDEPFVNHDFNVLGLINFKSDKNKFLDIVTLKFIKIIIIIWNVCLLR